VFPQACNTLSLLVCTSKCSAQFVCKLNGPRPKEQSSVSEDISARKSHLCNMCFTFQWIRFTMIELRQLEVGLPQRRTGYNPRPMHAGFVVNLLNAELNPICRLLVLLGDLTFMGPCIISIFQYMCISNKMQRYTVYLHLENVTLCLNLLFFEDCYSVR
jgi:hypothetical protein